MNPSLAENSPAPDDSGRWRAKLARKWAYLITATAYLPLPHAELEQRLLELVDELATLLTEEPEGVDQRAADIGAQLVDMHCTGPDSLRRTMDVLGRDLLAQPELRLPGLPERVVRVLGAIAAGYSEALRMWVFEQQESVNGAFVEVMRDINRKLLASEARFDQLSLLSVHGVVVTDSEDRILRCNSAFCRIVDSPMDEVIGRDLLQMFDPADAPGLRESYRKLGDGSSAPTFRRRRCAVRRDGEAVTVYVSAALLDDEEPEKFVTVVDAETASPLPGDRQDDQPTHDGETQLPTRQYFVTHLKQMLRRADPRFGVTVYHLYLDAFSAVAVGVSRQAGVLLLREAAIRLKEVFAGEQAMLARLGVDEFAAVVRNSPVTPNFVTMVGRINEALAEPFYVDGQGLTTSACIGVVHQPSLDTDPDELLRMSEITLRRARDLGHRQWALFDPAEYARERESDSLAAAMPGAWENGEIEVVYQPVVQLRDRRLAAVEALLRWNRPGIGVLSPQRCRELAERTGLISSLVPWAMRKACEGVARWPEVPVVLGLCQCQAANPDLAAAVVNALEGSGVPGTRVLVMMPLGALLDERGEAAETLRVLADIGVGVALADFAGSPADLAYLADVPVQTVQLSPRLARAAAGSGIGSPSIDRPLKELMGFLRSAGTRVIVPAVETLEEATWWAETGADLATGPAFGPGAELNAVLGDSRPA